MSQQGSAVTWENVTSTVSEIVNVLGPIAEIAVPGVGPAIAIGTKIIQGFVNEEPSAVALYNQIKSGTPPTPTQLADFAAQYETAYQKLNDDINAKLAALPAP